MTPETTTTQDISSSTGSQVWPEWVYPYPAGITGGLLGGAAVAVVGLVYGVLSGNTWLPVNSVAATLLRDMQARSVEELSRFDMVGLLAGAILHAAISIGLGLVFTVILPALPGRPLYWGPVIGPLLWVGAVVAVLPVLNPVMAENLEWVSFGLANVLYGVILGWWIDRTPLIHLNT